MSKSFVNVIPFCEYNLIKSTTPYVAIFNTESIYKIINYSDIKYTY